MKSGSSSRSEEGGETKTFKKEGLVREGSDALA